MVNKLEGYCRGHFQQIRDSERPPPSDVEIRLRCLEASARGNDPEHTDPSSMVETLKRAQKYYAFVKGNAYLSSMPSVIDSAISKPMDSGVLTSTSNTSGGQPATRKTG